MAVHVPPARVPQQGPSPLGALAILALVLGSIVGFAVLGKEPATPRASPMAALAAPVPTLSPTSSPPGSAEPSARAPDFAARLTLEPAGDEPATITLSGEITWRVYGLPDGHHLRSVLATAHGLVAVDKTLTGANALGSSFDGAAWRRIGLSISPGQVHAAGDDLVADDGVDAVRLAWKGGQWTEIDHLDIAGVAPPGIYHPVPDRIEQVVFGLHGAIMTVGSHLLYSTDGHRFQPAEDPPDRTLPETAPATPQPADTPDGGGCGPSGGWRWPGPVLATRDGFVALTPYRPGNGDADTVCEPVVWRSADGRRWELVSPESPFGAGAWVHDVATDDGRLLAVGGTNDSAPSDPLAGEGAIWLSNDGLAWKRVVLDPPMRPLLAVAAGDFGWLALDEELRGWVSADGAAWMLAALPMISGGWVTTLDLSAWSQTIVIGRADEIAVGTAIEIEGTDILATTRARATPPVASCPPGSDPDRPGPADQPRPSPGGLLGHAMAFDRRAGRIVLLDSTSPETDAQGSLTWTFDVCANTWLQMHPAQGPPRSDLAWLVYDADSDRTIALIAGRLEWVPAALETWTYDLRGDRWSRGRDSPRMGLALSVAYDDVSGLVVARVSSGGMWAYDLEADRWTAVRERPDPQLWASTGTLLPNDILAFGYDALADRFVAYGALPATWTFDPWRGTWMREKVTTPRLSGGWVPTADAAFDEASGTTVFIARNGNQLAAFDATVRRWETLFDSTSTETPCVGDTGVYDPLNRRIVCTSGGSPDWQAADPWAGVPRGGVSAFDMRSRRWVSLLDPAPAPG